MLFGAIPGAGHLFEGDQRGGVMARRKISNYGKYRETQRSEKPEREVEGAREPGSNAIRKEADRKVREIFHFWKSLNPDLCRNFIAWIVV